MESTEASFEKIEPPFDQNPSTLKEEEEGSFDDADDGNPQSSSSSSSRTAFVNLSQLEADLALARTLQEQEWAYAMLVRDNVEEPQDHHEDDDNNDHAEEGEDHDHDNEDGNNDQHDHEDGDGTDDEQALGDQDNQAYYRRAVALQQLQHMVALLESVNIHGAAEHVVENHNHVVDPDDLSYEELLAIGEVVGTVSKGVSMDTIASLASMVYKDGEVNDSMCVICQCDYEDGDELSLIPCKHSYHSECLRGWLQNNKVCPVCSAEVSSAAVM